MVPSSLISNINNLENRFDEILDERKELLNEFADYIGSKINKGLLVHLTFICTHNSRRSHMSQIWAQTAAEFYKIQNIRCYSGGTEATQFNPTAVKTVAEFGFKIDKVSDSENPVYLVYFSEDKKPLACYSKVYEDTANPKKNFAAVMTCSHADENCPVVFGADARFPIKYEDPKEFDGSELEKDKYRERFEQIGIEMLFTFNRVKASLSN